MSARERLSDEDDTGVEIASGNEMALDVSVLVESTVTVYS